MKTLFLFLALCLALSGCNNLNSDVNPLAPGTDKTDYNYTIPSDMYYYPDEFWISKNHAVTISGMEMSVMFFYLTEEPDSSYNVTLWIAYEGGRMGDEMVEFNTKDTPYPYALELRKDTYLEFSELQIKRNKAKVKIRFIYTPPELCNPL
ncbi:MAG: hypothetical protein HF308_18050 [Ignavibacteria bacterium]|jgi:uncharacterized protein YceK|nr:hypothetical protein [Ignavibacteria bacterium]MCU7522576.1 hypothetical protein [Ignavibacteria bacterium]MCU7526384.1 hypothetical protein [Ignavibacteria bacterium]